MRRLAGSLLLVMASCSTGTEAEAPDSGAADAAPPSADAPAGFDAPVAYPDAALGGGEPASLAGITAAHNSVRSAHGVPPLTWDPQLAAIAQTWTDGCADTQAPTGLIDMNPNATTGYGMYVGQNVYGSTASTTGADAVAGWASEEADYDYTHNTCSGSCGSYTQVVWAASTKLGCGFRQCPSLTYGYSIVCHYAPGGNDGSRPY